MLLSSLSRSPYCAKPGLIRLAAASQDGREVGTQHRTSGPVMAPQSLMLFGLASLPRVTSSATSGRRALPAASSMTRANWLMILPLLKDQQV